MNVELNLEELEQIVEALNQKYDALSSGGTEVLSELQAVNQLYNRLRELREEHENNHDLSREEVGVTGAMEPKAALRCSVLWTALTPRV